MLLLWRRPLSLPPFAFLLCLMILCLILTKQVKDLYEKNQKNKRIQSYNEFLSEVSDSMNDLETTLNKTSNVVQQLSRLIMDRKQNGGGGVSQKNKHLKIP